MFESRRVGEQWFAYPMHDNFFIQYVLESTRGERVLDIVMSSQKELESGTLYLAHWPHKLIQMCIQINIKSDGIGPIG